MNTIKHFFAIGSILILGLVSLKTYAQPNGTYYINPCHQAPPGYVGQGTYGQPFLSFDNVTWADGNIYEIAHSCTLELSSPINIGADNIHIFWALGLSKPTITTASGVNLSCLVNTNGHNGIEFWSLNFDASNAETAILIDET